MYILDTICRSKRLEIARQKEAVSLPELKNILSSCHPALDAGSPETRELRVKSAQCSCHPALDSGFPEIRGLQVKPAMANTVREKVSFKQALLRSSSGIIAEFKRKSPAKAWIYPGADVAKVVQSYEVAGAAAISCLTDEPFFGGSLADFEKARETVKQIPLLRKDFILDEYQLYQSKMMGADVILLIAACLTKEEISRFTAVAHDLDMEVLLEIHEEPELASICPDIDVVGINNRNLKTFITDIRHTLDLASKIPDRFLKISESGLSDPETVIQLRRAGFRGFLMGENFMKTADPGETLREFIKSVIPRLTRDPLKDTIDCDEIAGQARNDELSNKIKVCGMKDPENMQALAELPVDMMGLIFYEQSPRYVEDKDAAAINALSSTIPKVGVFVDTSLRVILDKTERFRLQLVQLHGKESPEYCSIIRNKGIPVIKAIQIETAEDLKSCKIYEACCDYFLFDTPTPQYGGSGNKFDWGLLSAYTGSTPFFLSGGISPEDADSIKRLDFPLLFALDLNSRFEITPGIKDINSVKQFLFNIKNTM